MARLTKADKEMLHAIWEECDDQDKSTEYMIARMIDNLGLDYLEGHEIVIDFLVTQGVKEECQKN